MLIVKNKTHTINAQTFEITVKQESQYTNRNTCMAQHWNLHWYADYDAQMHIKLVGGKQVANSDHIHPLHF